MKVQRTVGRPISFAADTMAIVIRVVEPLVALFLRLLRLAKLRARVDGKVPVTTQFDGPTYTGGRAILQIGEHCRLGRSTYFETSEQGMISIGSHTRINCGTVIVSYSEVTIGSDCLVGEYVSIRDANHGTAPGRAIRTQEHDSAPIRIGDNVWIARGTVILKGVTIGDGAIIGANSVVSKDVPEKAVVAGVPAKMIRMRTSDEDT